MKSSKTREREREREREIAALTTSHACHLSWVYGFDQPRGWCGGKERKRKKKK